jgi:hypothetical protein
MRTLEDSRFPVPKGGDKDPVSTIRVIIEGKLGEEKLSTVRDTMENMAIAALETAGGMGFTNGLISHRKDADAVTVFVFDEDDLDQGAGNAFDRIGESTAEMISALTGLSCRGGTL